MWRQLALSFVIKIGCIIIDFLRPIIVTILLIMGIVIGGYVGLEKAPVTDLALTTIVYIVFSVIISVFIAGIFSVTFWILTNSNVSRRKKAVTNTIAIILLLGIFLILRRKPVACNQIQEIELRTLLISEQVTLEDVKKGIYDSYIKDPQVDRRYYGDVVPVVSWSGSNGIQYLGIFRDGVLKYIYVKWRGGETILEPTASEILDCFGEPDLVHIGAPIGWYEQMFLWYLDEGLIVSSAPLRYKEDIPKVNSNLIMWEMIIVNPGTVEEISEDIGYRMLIGPGEEENSKILDYVQPWPGSLEAVVSR